MTPWSLSLCWDVQKVCWHNRVMDCYWAGAKTYYIVYAFLP